MKRISLLLIWLCTSPLHATDIVPTRLDPIDRDPFFAPDAKGETQVGFTFEELQDFSVDPLQEGITPSRSLRRSLELSHMVHAQLELGLSLRQHQESDPFGIQVDTDQLDRPYSGGVWTRLKLLQTETLRSSLQLQYEPKAGENFSLYHLAQDRTSLGLHLDYGPTSWLRGGVYVLGSRREDERHLDYRLGDEGAVGARLSLGPKLVRIFGEYQQREIHVKKILEDREDSWQIKGQTVRAGLAARVDGFELTASLLIPTQERFFGVAERGLLVTARYQFGSRSKSDEFTTRRQQVEPAPPVAPPTVAPGWTFPQVESPTRSTTIRTAVPPIESSDPDEFQLFDQKMNEERRRGQEETPQEKAEREMREMVAVEKLEEARLKAEEERRLQAERAEEAKRMRREAIEDRAYEKVIDRELEDYTLPDEEELRWNGLE